MNSSRYYSINKFVNEISELLKNISPEWKFINVYFDDCHKGAYNWSIKPIGFAVILNDKTAKKISYYDVHKLMPEMEFINISESKDRQFSKLPLTKQLHKLIISRETRSYNGHEYHKSFLKDADQSLHQRKLKEYSDDRVRYVNELGESDIRNEPEIDIDDIDI